MRSLTFLLAGAGLLTPLLRAQQVADSAAPSPKNVVDARAALVKAEAEHPGNTAEVADALNDLVGAQLDAELASDETLTLVNREAAVALAASGPRGKDYVAALATTSEVYVALSQPAKA